MSDRYVCFCGKLGISTLNKVGACEMILLSYHGNVMPNHGYLDTIVPPRSTSTNQQRYCRNYLW